MKKYGRDHLSQMVTLRITNNGTNVALDGVQWEGHSVTHTVFLPKIFDMDIIKINWSDTFPL